MPRSLRAGVRAVARITDDTGALRTKGPGSRDAGLAVVFELLPT